MYWIGTVQFFVYENKWEHKLLDIGFCDTSV